MTTLRTILVAGLVAGTIPTGSVRAEDPLPLPGTRPLTMEGDLAAKLVAGVDRFLLRKTEESEAGRAKFWNRDRSSAEAYTASIAPNRARLAHILGIRDPRLPFDGFELAGTTTRPAKLATGHGYEIVAVRWPAVDGVHGEGLLLAPEPFVAFRLSGFESRGFADVIALPDADQTPEQLVGLAPGLPDEAQYARRLAEAGCRVLVPSLIPRTLEPRNGRVKLTHREYLYRPAFELGRHILGYELQKIFAAVDQFEREGRAQPVAPTRKIGVIGWGEGGWLALLAGAIDPRIDAVGVSGAFGDADNTWRQPIDRNVFGLLEQFGDAELAAMIGPRSLVIERAKGPEVTIAPGNGGAPGRLTTPNSDRSRRELLRARELLQGLNPHATHHAAVPAQNDALPWGDAALTLFTAALSAKLPDGTPANVNPLGPPCARPGAQAPLPDPTERTRRQVAEIDRHTQRLLVESPSTRQAFFQRLDTSTPETFRATIAAYRETFRDEVIGRFDDPFLPPDPRSRRIFQTPTVTGYEVVLDVWPDVFACGILLVPTGIAEGERRPVVVCQHGLEGRPRDVADPSVNHPAYNQFALRLAERGFVTFAPQNLYIGQDQFRTLQRKANPLKKTLFSLIVPQHQVITDWLKAQPFVDPSRIAFYGLSYGGKSAMRIPPLVDNYHLAICSADFNDWVWKNASTHSSYSYVWTGEYEIFEWDLGSTFNYAEMAALIAPRPFMVERGHFDGVAPDETVAYEFAKVRHLYAARLKLPEDRCRIEFFDGPHTIHGVGTFAFLHHHLNWPKR